LGLASRQKTEETCIDLGTLMLSIYAKGQQVPAAQTFLKTLQSFREPKGDWHNA